MTASLIPQPALSELLRIAEATPPGDFAEFGVYQGGGAQYLATIARRQGRALYLLDTFCGMPHAGPQDSHAVGDFADTSLEAVRALIPDAIFLPGTFPESVQGFVFAKPLAFVHVDCDQRQSILDACAFFPALIPSGGVMLFDDFGVLPGATRAVLDWADATGAVIGVTSNGKAMWRKP
jgi:O-methyltransferase